MYFCFVLIFNDCVFEVKFMEGGESMFTEYMFICFL